MKENGRSDHRVIAEGIFIQEVLMDPKGEKPGRKSTRKDDVKYLMRKLDSWSKGLPKSEQVLLRQLLGRVEKDKVTVRVGKYEIKANLELVVLDALKGVMRVGPVPGPLPIWARMLPPNWLRRAPSEPKELVTRSGARGAGMSVGKKSQG